MFNTTFAIASLISGSYNNSSELGFNNDYVNIENTVDLLSKINEGARLVYDYCEIVDPDITMFTVEKKPYCLYNYSFIDSNNTIHISTFRDELRSFFIDKKNRFCQEENLMCGELTVLIRLLDLINGVTTMIGGDPNNKNIWINLQIIDFKNLYNLYVQSLDNIEILMNITLKRQMASIYLEREKTRLAKILNKAYYERFTDGVYTTIGGPISDAIRYTGSTIGNLFGEMIDGVFTTFSSESKMILAFIAFIFLRRF